MTDLEGFPAPSRAVCTAAVQVLRGPVAVTMACCCYPSPQPIYEFDWCPATRCSTPHSEPWGLPPWHSLQRMVPLLKMPSAMAPGVWRLTSLQRANINPMCKGLRGCGIDYQHDAPLLWGRFLLCIRERKYLEVSRRVQSREKPKQTGYGQG